MLAFGHSQNGGRRRRKISEYATISPPHRILTNSATPRLSCDTALKAFAFGRFGFVLFDPGFDQLADQGGGEGLVDGEAVSQQATVSSG